MFCLFLTKATFWNKNKTKSNSWNLKFWFIHKKTQALLNKKRSKAVVLPAAAILMNHDFLCHDEPLFLNFWKNNTSWKNRNFWIWRDSQKKNQVWIYCTSFFLNPICWNRKTNLFQLMQWWAPILKMCLPSCVCHQCSTKTANTTAAVIISSMQ